MEGQTLITQMSDIENLYRDSLDWIRACQAILPDGIGKQIVLQQLGGVSKRILGYHLELLNKEEQHDEQKEEDNNSGGSD